jgi:hypothetical protein
MHRSDLDPTLEAICLKAMAKPVADRYNSMGELAAALTDYLRSSSAGPASPAPSSSPVPPSPTRWIWPSVSAGAVLLLRLGLVNRWPAKDLPGQTKGGTVVVDVPPRQADVFKGGGKVAVAPRDGDGPGAVAPGNVKPNETGETSPSVVGDAQAKRASQDKDVFEPDQSEAAKSQVRALPVPSEPTRHDGDFRRVRPRPGILRRAGPDAKGPTEPFWPILTVLNTESWILGDPDGMTLSQKGLTIQAGTHGNFLLTKQSDFRKGSLRIALALEDGPEAFLVLHGRSEADQWHAVTSRLRDDKASVRAGRLGTEFSADEAGSAFEAKSGSVLAIRFEDDGRGNRHVFVGNKKTASVGVKPGEARNEEGAIGLFVTTGTVLVRNIHVE